MLAVQALGHQADEQEARTGKAHGRNDGNIVSYLLKRELYRTVWVLGRGGAMRGIPIRDLATFGDGETLDVLGRPRVIRSPGHTDGSAVLLLEERGVLFTWTGGADEAVRVARAAGPS